jgi:high frequency lysogenization protein
LTSIAWQKRVLALAGMLQAVHLVAGIARTGLVSQDAMEQSLRSIFVQNPASISEVFAGTGSVRTGLNLAAEILGGFDFREHSEVMRYCLAVIKLERSLSRNPELLRELGARIASIDERRMLRQNGEHNLDEDTVAALADLYQDTLSRISPRIKVSGKRNYLQNETNTGRIRALLLAAVRSAVLWHQVGGRRWQLLLSRHQMTDALQYVY